MNLKVYTNRKYNNDKTLEKSIGKSIITDSATTLYMQLENACSIEIDIYKRYDFLRNVFAHAVDQFVINCQIEFVGFFAKLDYCIKECEIPYSISNLLQLARKDLFPESNKKRESSEENLNRDFPHNLKATTLLVYYLFGKKDIPSSLREKFPKADRKAGWGKFDEKMLRVVVNRWDDNYIWVTEEENDTEIKVCYSDDNKYLTREGNGSWAYLKQILWEGAQLNLVQIRKSEHGDIYLPELIILEPDFLINITTIAGCFESYAESPFVNLVKKISPQPNSVAIHLGNLAGQFLDDTVHGREISFNDSMSNFINKNALAMITCDELKAKYSEFLENGQNQKKNIKNLIGTELPSHIGSYNTKDVVLEPSFFSEVLGIQGRFDFLYKDNNHVTIIEQKSGKGEFIPYNSPLYNPEKPVEKEQHAVQAILYRALYQYEFQTYANDINMMLLYSKYAKGLLQIPAMPKLFLRAMKIRNLLAWSEYLYAKEGMDVLTTLTPEKLNQKHSAGKLWDNYTKPQLSELLSPIQKASKLELMYYLRFLRFLENEQLLAKVGNKQKESSGFASIWHDSLEDKKSAGNIYDNLVIVAYGLDKTNESSVESVTLKFLDQTAADTANFRMGDIVILYPYQKDNVPNACADMVSRASIVDINEDTVVLRLRNSQTDKHVFEKPDDWLWAIEHDMFESMTGALYSAMHSFLNATKERRDLILSQRQPEVDNQRQLKGDYGSFNTLSLSAKQAKDLFLIIGPPGTGKTSYGLTNLLKEELLEENTNVLLLSYTNRAVDEICSKLIEIKKDQPEFDFIRIGSDLSCSKEYREYLLSSRASQLYTGKDAYQLVRNCRVFCGTTSALNANMSLFKIKHFTLAIVDESSQILEPHLVGLLSANNNGVNAIDKFVLIGDHKQLPAVVQQSPEESIVTEPELNDINLTDCRLSLFERLLKQFKTPEGYDERYVYMLTKQGRMHRDIAEFPNYAFYGNKLGIVPLDHQELPNKRKTGNGIIELLTTRRISFVASETPRLSPSVKTNHVEAEMIAATVYQIYNLTKETIEGFDEDKTVGVIVPYRNQISTVRNAIDKFGISLLHNITIDTVERYQGSQRDYIIYGFTIQQPYQLNFLTNNVFEEDGMVIDRKLNVAMTRARLNLVMFGNPILLNENFTFYKLMEFVRSKGGYFDVPAEDYCMGEFYVPEIVRLENYDFSHYTYDMGKEFSMAFNRHVINPIKNDLRTDWPNIIMGNKMDVNMSLINYGRIDFSNQLTLFSVSENSNVALSPDDQVKLYCYYIMRMHYFSAKSIYHSYSDWLTSMAKDTGGRIRMIDIGCGPGTCGIAFTEMFQQVFENITYIGIDVSNAMKTMADSMMSELIIGKTRTEYKTSFHQLVDSYWDSILEVPSLILINMSYFFSNVDSTFTENLANRMIDVMKKYPLNKYVFIIQQSEHDSKIRSYIVFRKRLSDFVDIIKTEKTSFSYQLNGGTRCIPLCYSIWRSK